MNHKHILATLVMLAFSQVNASDKIGIKEDSEEKSASFTMPHDLRVALNGMKEACRIQNRFHSYQAYKQNLLEFIRLYPIYNIDDEAAKKIMFDTLSPLFNNN